MMRDAKCFIGAAPSRRSNLREAKSLLLFALFAPFVCSFAQSSLDAPAKAQTVTVRSEIQRGCHEISAAQLPNDPMERREVAERIINENDRIGRKTDGFVLGVNFSMWLYLEILWEVYPVGSIGKESAEAVGGSVWLNVQADLAKTGLTMTQLMDASGLSSGDVRQRIQRWKQATGSEDFTSKARDSAATRDSNAFHDEPRTLYASVRQPVTAKTSSGSVDLKPGDLVLVTARNSKFARVDLNGQTATIPLSATDLAEQ
jgi:hypothetical protein